MLERLHFIRLALFAASQDQVGWTDIYKLFTKHIPFVSFQSTVVLLV